MTTPLMQGFLLARSKGAGMESPLPVRQVDSPTDSTCSPRRTVSWKGHPVPPPPVYSPSPSPLSRKTLGRRRLFCKMRLGIAAMGLAALYIAFRVGEQLAEQRLLQRNSRDEMVQSQEQVLVSLLRKANEEEKDSGVSEKLLRHIQVLKTELERKNDAISEQREKMADMDLQVKEAWGAYQLYTAELQSMQEQHQADMSRLAKTLVAQRFGSAPHYVEFELRLWHEHPTTPQVAFVTIEMAPVDLMPVSVLWFLEQVEAGLWDETSFRINTPNLLQAQPVSVSSVSRLPEMDAKGLALLPFSEYSSAVRHKAYTLAFAPDRNGGARPGPGFFVNKIDNIESHKGIPCFANVIIGHEVIDRMGRMESSETLVVIKPVEIVSAQILTTLQEAVGGQEYLKERDLRSEEI